LDRAYSRVHGFGSIAEADIIKILLAQNEVEVVLKLAQHPRFG
jgi:hypothetical protein